MSLYTIRGILRIIQDTRLNGEYPEAELGPALVQYLDAMGVHPADLEEAILVLTTMADDPNTPPFLRTTKEMS